MTTMAEFLSKVRIRRAPHPETRKVPGRWVVHRMTHHPAIWIAHETTAKCTRIDPSLEFCHSTMVNTQGGANGGALDLIQQADKESRGRRLRFLAEMQARGRYTS